MQLIQFTNYGEAYELGRKFLSHGLYDNVTIANLQNYFMSGMYWKLDSVKGFLALNNIVPKRDATVTILVLPNQDKRGKYRAMLDELNEHKRYLFSEFGFERLTAMVDVRNRPSRLLCTKLGFTCEGIVPHGSQLGRDFRNMMIFGILREEVDNHGNHWQSVGTGRDSESDVRSWSGEYYRVRIELERSGSGSPGVRDWREHVGPDSAGVASRADGQLGETGQLVIQQFRGNGDWSSASGGQPVGELVKQRPSWYARRVWQCRP